MDNKSKRSKIKIGNKNPDEKDFILSLGLFLYSFHWVKLKNLKKFSKKGCKILKVVLKFRKVERSGTKW